VANTFADAGCDVSLWGRDAAVMEAIGSRHENPKYLKGIPLNPALRPSYDLGASLHEAELIVCSIPTQQIRKVFAPHAAALAGKPVVNTSKGIEMGTHQRVSELFASLAPQATYVVLSGPSFAEEVARRLPTAVTIASADKDAATRVQLAMSTPYFRSYTATDVLGVELAGALKNVIAIAAGIVNGLSLGYNAQAAVINRGIAEIARAGASQGAQPMTFLGLAGMGDLVLTCTGPLSRNRRLGMLLGGGGTLADAQGALGGVAEGVYTSQAANELAAKWKIEMPILAQVYGILYEGKTPKQALGALMGRDLKAECDFA
jgi:glycerol-3-phosphate dehydrogenase (NAD(P)+)